MAPTRYRRRIKRLLEKERQVRPLPPGGDLSVCLVYPNSYRVGMASLGFQVVRRLFLQSGCAVERTFLPEPAEEEDLRAGGLLLPAWESLRPARQFDLLAFSVPFELDFLNIVRMLLLAGIPARAQERHQGHPLVIAGGAAATINPRPLAHFLDVAVLGESERLLPRLVKIVSGLKGDRVALLQKLAEEPGLFVPSLHGDPESRREKPPPLSAGDLAISDVASPEAEFGDTVLMEVGRGCGMGCRFCWAGWACRPLRSHDLEEMLAAVDGLPEGFDRFGLIATSHFDHPRFLDLVRGLRTRGKSITVSALRIDHVEGELLDALAEGGTRSVALAPETGSEELRLAVGKRFGNRSVIEAAEAVADAGLDSLKLYFLLGLPGEGDGDIDAIADLVSRVLDAVSGRLQISLSVNFFIPKPGTPFAGEPLPRGRELRRRMQRLKKTVARLPEVELSAMAPWQAVLQTLLSRGGPEVGELLLRGAKEGWSLSRLCKEVPRELIAKVVYRISGKPL